MCGTSPWTENAGVPGRAGSFVDLGRNNLPLRASAGHTTITHEKGLHDVRGGEPVMDRVSVCRY